MSWTVFIVDDHPLIRNSLRALLADMPEMEVIGEAGDLPSAVSQLKFRRADLILLDLSLQEGTSLAQLEKWKLELPARKIVVITMHRDWHYLEKVAQAGADGYLLKDTPVPAIAEALRDILHKDRKVFPAPAAEAPPEDDIAERLRSLSRREKEILKLVAGGYMNKEIALALELSVRTVESHRSRLLAKLGVKNAASLAAFGRYLA